MAGRIRTIKPEILEDERAASLSSDAWRLWVSMWLICDDFGRLRGDSRRLAASIFWACPHRVDIGKTISELEVAGLVSGYQVRGQKYIAIANWSKHQRIDNASKTFKMPGPEEADQGDLAAVRGESPRVAAVRGSDMDMEKDKEEDKDKEIPASPEFDFEPVYAAYPHKVGRKKGEQRFRSQITTPQKYDALLKSVRNYAASVAGKDPQYMKHFDTFMNCWEDFVEYQPPLKQSGKFADAMDALPEDVVYDLENIRGK